MGHFASKNNNIINIIWLTHVFKLCVFLVRMDVSSCFMHYLPRRLFGTHASQGDDIARAHEFIVLSCVLKYSAICQ